MDILKGLNKEQKEAVTHKKGPLLIIAGAGTGKTTVITRRIAYLIAKKLAKPNEILALTFTDKAAAEMEERVDVLVPYGFVDTWISTFHAFGDRILRNHAFELGLPPDFQVLTRPQQVLFILEHLFEFDLEQLRPLANPTKYIEALTDLFSRIKDEDISEEEYIKYAQKRIRESDKTDKSDRSDKIEAKKELEVALAFKKYNELIHQAGCIDFGDQIVLTLKLFREKPHILKKYQQQFKYILVDEFQDTNYAQNELLKLLANGIKDKNVTVVADDDQSIYRFRGAAVSNVLDFTKNFPNTKIITLIQNYRSPQEILDAAYRLIRHNDPDRLEVKNKINKKLKAQKRGRGPIYIHCENLSAETEKVAEIIFEKINKSNKSNKSDKSDKSDRTYQYKDFAILVRKNNQIKPFVDALTYKGIPFKTTSSMGLYFRPEIRLIISFINALTDPSDSISLFHLATSEIYNLEINEAINLNTYAKNKNLYLSEVFKQLTTNNPQLTTKSKNIIEKINKDLNKWRQKALHRNAGEIVYDFLKESGYLKKLLKKAQENPVVNAQLMNIANFFEKIKEFIRTASNDSIFNFKNHLEALISAGDDPATAEIDPDQDAVNILTVHKAKGLEFPVVFLVNLVNNSFPARKQPEPLALPDGLIKETLPEGDYHLQEERRLFYVGMTRAKDELYLLSADDYGTKKPAKLSQFVLEALDVPKIESEKYKINHFEILSKSAAEKQISPFILKNFLKQGILILTPSQIDDYLSCPKKFEYIHILKIPILQHHSVVYGSAIHQAVAFYFNRKLNHQPVSLDDLIKIYENAWENSGFITREHEEKRFEAGKKALKEFFEKEEKLNQLPISVEEPFEFVLPFVSISSSKKGKKDREEFKIKIKGRYDAVYRFDRSDRSDKSDRSDRSDKSDYIEIRDFKTSEVGEQEKADDKAKKSRQLSIYALAYQQNNKYLPDAVSLYFVDTGTIGRAKKTEKDLEKTKKEIEEVARGIKNNDFAADPDWQQCNFCAYSQICPDRVE